jgi:hypothetical protein
VDDVVTRVQAALAAGDWAAVRPLLHPYLHWTAADGSVLRGRTRVLAMLQASPGAPPPPRSVELRDGQVYRWQV